MKKKGQFLIISSFVALAAVILAMMAATILEKTIGSSVAFRWVYHNPVFFVLWAVAAVSGLCLVVARTAQRFWTMLLHISFVVILGGALLTHLVGEQGFVRLPKGEAVSTWIRDDGTPRPLPCPITLEDFEVQYYAGSEAAADYRSRIRVEDRVMDISMNHIARVNGYRLFQSGFDEQSSVLTVNHDPWGIGLTYTGYALLLLSLIGFFFQKGTGFRKTLGKFVRSSAFLVAFLFLSMAEAGEMSGQDFQILQQFPQYFGDQPMTNGPVYVGALICALFLLGCVVVKGPVKWALVVVTFFTMFLSWGHNMMWLTDWMIDYFPMYNKFRTPASILVIAEITMPLLAVLALKEMMTDLDFMKKNRGAFYGSFGFCALVCLVTWLAPGIFGSYSAMEHEQLVASGQIQQYPTVDAAIRAVRGSMVSADAGRSLLVLVLGFAVLMAFVMNKVKASVASAALALVVLVDMYAVDKRYVNQDTFVSHYDVTPTAFQPRPVDVQILQDSTLHYRVLDQQHFAEAMPSYFHKTVGGYHAAKLTRYNDLIERQLSRANMAVLNMLNTRYVILTDSVAQLNAGALGNAWFVDSLAYVAGADAEMAALDSIEPARWAVADGQFQQVLGAARPHQPGDTIALTAYAPNRLTYRAHSAQGGLAVFSEVFFPWGWKATIDGQPAQIGRVNYVLRAMQLPAGDHTVEMVFDPEEVHTTDAVARWAIIAIFVLLLAAVNVAVFRQMKKTK